MRAAKITLAGRERYLMLTVDAMGRLEEEFGGVSQLIDALEDRGRQGSAAACKAAAILAEGGELARRALGYDPVPLADEAAIMATMQPKEAMGLRMVIPQVISLGFGRDVEPEDDEIDLGLAELNAQKKHRDPGSLPAGRDAVRPVGKGKPAVRSRGADGSVGALPSGSRGAAKNRGGLNPPRRKPGRGSVGIQFCFQRVL